MFWRPEEAKIDKHHLRMLRSALFTRARSPQLSLLRLIFSGFILCLFIFIFILQGMSCWRTQMILLLSAAPYI